MKKVFCVLSFLVLLVACGDDVPNPVDVQHPKDASGNKMNPMAWVTKFCQGKADMNPYCMAVKKSITKDSGRGEMPKGY